MKTRTRPSSEISSTRGRFERALRGEQQLEECRADERPRPRHQLVRAAMLSVRSCRATRRRVRAKRLTHGDLTAAPRRAREQQVAEVGARDQQHERDGAHEHEELSACAANDRLLSTAARRSASRHCRSANRGASLRGDRARFRRALDRTSTPARRRPTTVMKY